jgi:hypothetical protein
MNIRKVWVAVNAWWLIMAPTIAMAQVPGTGFVQGFGTAMQGPWGIGVGTVLVALTGLDVWHQMHTGHTGKAIVHTAFGGGMLLGAGKLVNFIASGS